MIQSCQKAFSCLLKGAEGGDPDSQEVLGVIYSRGWGVKCDLDEAIRWLKASADSGQVSKGPLSAMQNLVDFYYDDGETNLALKVLGVSGSDFSNGVSGITQTSVIGDFVKDNFENSNSDYAMAAVYLEKMLKLPTGSWKEEYVPRLQSKLAICYLAMLLDEAKKENVDETKCKEYVKKSTELTTTALEHNEPTAYFSKLIMLMLAGAAGNDVVEEINRLEAQLKQLANSGNEEAKRIHGLMARMALAIQSMGALQEGMDATGLHL